MTIEVILTLPVLIALGAVLLIAASIEFRTKMIPNRLCGIALVVGIVLATFDGRHFTHLAGFGAGFTLGLATYMYGVAGGGYTKLLIAAGTIAGPLLGVVTTALSVLLIGYFHIIEKFNPPPEVRYHGETQQSTHVKGSLMILAGTAVSILLQLRPWD